MRLRYGPVRVHLLGDTVRARAFLPEARRISLRAQEWWRMSPGGPIARNVKLGPGVDCTVRIAAGHVSIYVHAEPIDAPHRRLPVADTTPTIWIPRGFVVYPISEISPNGWGAPPILIEDGEDGEDGDDESTRLLYPENLAPGLDVSRWTPGGAGGQVLITRVPDAGYPSPERVISPLCFDPNYGPVPTDARGKLEVIAPAPEGTEPWGAYRLEYVGFDHGGWPALDISPEERAHIVRVKEKIFHLTNEVRASAGVGVVGPPIRGFSDGAQATTEAMYDTLVIGHYAPQYPAGFKTLFDRYTRDGISGTSWAEGADNNSRNVAPPNTGENLVFFGWGAEEVGPTPSGDPIYEFESRAEMTAEMAIDSWVNSPPHYSNMIYDKWGRDSDYLSGYNIGYRYCAATQFFFARDNWLQFGNKVYRSPIPGVPVLSWFGPQTLNLSLETWPIAIGDWSAPTWQDRIAVASGGSINAPIYVDSKDRAISNSTQSIRMMFDSRLFAYGRCIGNIPDDGLVLGASFRRIDADDGGHIYRLLVLAHHDADQVWDVRSHGATNILRIWYCDIPQKDGDIPFRPDLFIRGVYGEEDEGWPWDVVENPWSWRRGATIDVGTTDGVTRDLCMYNSLWEFNASGTKAVCLRDNTRPVPLFNDMYGIFGEYEFRYNRPRAVELDVTDPENPVFTVLAQGAFEVNRPASYLEDPANPVYPDGSSWTTWQVRLTPVTAYYDGDEVKSAYIVNVLGAKELGPSSVSVALRIRLQHSFVGWASYGVTEPEAIEGMTRYSVYPRRVGNNVGADVYPEHHQGTPYGVSILSNSHRAFAVVHSTSKWWLDRDPALSDLPLAFYDSDMPCGIHRGEKYCKATVYVGGEMVHTSKHGKIDETLPDPETFCSYALIDANSGAGVYSLGWMLFVRNTSPWAVVSWAEHGDDWVGALVIRPQYNAFTVSTRTWEYICGTEVPGQDGLPVPDIVPMGCGWPVYEVSSVGSRARSIDPVPVWCGASLPDLQDLTQTPGSSFSLLQAGYV